MDSTEYFAKMFTGKSDTMIRALSQDFTLFLALMTFEMIHSHILDHHVKSDDVKRKNIEQLPDMIVDQWLKERLSTLRNEIDELKQRSKDATGMVLSTVLGDPDKIEKSQSEKIKFLAKTFRKILKTQ